MSRILPWILCLIAAIAALVDRRALSLAVLAILLALPWLQALVGALRAPRRGRALALLTAAAVLALVLAALH